MCCPQWARGGGSVSGRQSWHASMRSSEKRVTWLGRSDHWTDVGLRQNRMLRLRRDVEGKSPRMENASSVVMPERISSFRLDIAEVVARASSES